MCEVCAQVSDRVRLLVEDARETCYMIMYTIACSFQRDLGHGDHALPWYGIPSMACTSEPTSGRTSATSMASTTASRLARCGGPSGRRPTPAHGRRSISSRSCWSQCPRSGAPCSSGRSSSDAPGDVGPRGRGLVHGRAHGDGGRYADIMLDIILAMLICYCPGGSHHAGVCGRAHRE